jgi:hypothetical protein
MTDNPVYKIAINSNQNLDDVLAPIAGQVAVVLDHRFPDDWQLAMTRLAMLIAEKAPPEVDEWPVEYQDRIEGSAWVSCVWPRCSLSAPV